MHHANTFATLVQLNTRVKLPGPEFRQQATMQLQQRVPDSFEQRCRDRTHDWRMASSIWAGKRQTLMCLCYCFETGFLSVPQGCQDMEHGACRIFMSSLVPVKTSSCAWRATCASQQVNVCKRALVARACAGVCANSNAMLT